MASCPVRLVASCFPRFSNAWRVFLDINEVIKLIVKVLNYIENAHRFTIKEFTG
jgi:hypothetical protein